MDNNAQPNVNTAPQISTERVYQIVYAVKKESTIITISFLTSRSNITSENSQMFEDIATSLTFD